MESQRGIEAKGGTMRLGRFGCRLTPGTLAAELYGKEEIGERHRHRYEFNNQFRKKLEAAGLRISGVNPEQDLAEIVEIPDHPYFIGCP